MDAGRKSKDDEGKSGYFAVTAASAYTEEAQWPSTVGHAMHTHTHTHKDTREMLVSVPYRRSLQNSCTAAAAGDKQQKASMMEEMRRRGRMEENSLEHTSRTSRPSWVRKEREKWLMRGNEQRAASGGVAQAMRCQSRDAAC